ncbi:MAG: RecQ family ATP-dependent DNA helicase [Paludibacter sp.]|nr:RecQ family ATP-dependent DNA helicase [Paludibacter sp.]
MNIYNEILQKYWGYESFRPFQKEIIESIGSRRDTLGLMPTGGGKSLTFQVPAMSKEGVCVIVTPLIALMIDQVENLRKREISAAAVHSGMSVAQIQLTLDNAVLGAYKFLYISPERLGTEIFQKKIIQTEVSMLVVDEAHCISQWGYDFRPAYLKIAQIRKLLPEIPVLALTATATPDVIDNIQNKLLFKEKNVFRASFVRENLSYVVRTTENKEDQLLKILNNVTGSSIVYVRSRIKTKELAEFLNTKGISAEHFHAGLATELKNAIQKRWTNDQTRVIVATNAFGMGIDKPNVRTVVHIDLPDSLEAYFQEAGRAGRDGNRAFAVLLYNNSDATKLKKRISDAFPEKEYVLKVYDALCNYLEIAMGSGMERTFAFDLTDFCKVSSLSHLQAYNALKLLQQAGYIDLTDEQDSTSSVIFNISKEELYKIKHSEEHEKLIHVLLRSYTGLFTTPAYISEETIASRLDWTRQDVYENLILLSKENVIDYIPRKQTPFLTYTLERQDVKYINLGKEVYENRLERYQKRIDKILEYAQDETVCRLKILLAYFGQTDVESCGKCDICLKNKDQTLATNEFDVIGSEIEKLLHNEPQSIQFIIKNINKNERKVMDVVRFLIDNETITLDKATMKLKLKSV